MTLRLRRKRRITALSNPAAIKAIKAGAGHSAAAVTKAAAHSYVRYGLLFVVSLLIAPLNAQQAPAIFAPPNNARSIWSSRPASTSSKPVPASTASDAIRQWKPRAPLTAAVRSTRQSSVATTPAIIRDPDPLSWRARRPATISLTRHEEQARDASAVIVQVSDTNDNPRSVPQRLNPAMVDPWSESAKVKSIHGDAAESNTTKLVQLESNSPIQQPSEPTLAAPARDASVPQTPTLAAPRHPDSVLRREAPAEPSLAPPHVDPFDDPFEDLRFAERNEPSRAESLPELAPTPSLMVAPENSDIQPAPTPVASAPGDLPSPADHALSRLSECEKRYENYQEEDRDCVVAKCEMQQNAISYISLSLLPAGDQLPYECRLDDESYLGRHWIPTTFTWKASALCHKPLYFEEVQLERYGHTAGPVAQPVISTAHFFANIAVWPYQLGMNPCSECRYALGYYRPGSCAPWLIDPIPFSRRGAILQSAAVLGAISVIP